MHSLNDRLFLAGHFPIMDMSRTVWSRLVAALLITAVFQSGCTTLREISNLKDVSFQVDRATDVQLAGISVERVDSFDDLGAADIARLTAAMAEKELPLSFTLHVGAENPETNSVDARLTKMDWTLLLEDKETISGKFNREVVLPPGEPKDIPVDIRLDLVRFYNDNLQGLVDLAASVGGSGPPTNVKLEVQPTIQTRLGPMRYPNPITVVATDVGS